MLGDMTSNDPGAEQKETWQRLLDGAAAAIRFSQDADLAVLGVIDHEASSGAINRLQAVLDDSPGTVELGYRLRRAAWGKGYATEGSRALIHKGFAELGVARVYARTMAVNIRSRRVMERSGLRYVRTFHQRWDEPLPGAEHGEVEYALDRADWQAARQSDLPGISEG